MSGNKIVEITFVCLAGIAAVYCALGIIVGRAGNSVANLAMQLSFVAPIFGFLSPKKAVYGIFILGVGLNMIKRLMVQSGAMSGTDLIWANAPAVLLLAGALPSTLLSVLHKGEMFNWRNLVLFGLPSAIFCGLLFSVFTSGVGLGQALNSAANSGAYFFLIPVIVVHFSRIDDFLKLVRLTIVIYLTVVFYGLWQSQFGLNKLDLYYVRSGWTITSEGYYGSVARAFSTQQSPYAFGAVSMICAFLCLSLAYIKGEGKISEVLTIGVLVVFMLYSFGVVSAGVRNVFVGYVGALIAFIFFRRRWSAMLLYGSGVILWVLMMLFSREAAATVQKLSSFTANLSNNTRIQRMVTLSTVSDRFIGLNNMRTNSELWTPFGLRGKGGLDSVSEADLMQSSNRDIFQRRSRWFVHDFFSATIVRFGYIPSAVFLLMGFVVTFRLHGIQQSIANTREGASLRAGMAIVAGCMATGFGSFRALSQFPTNAFFMMVVALCIVAAEKAIVRKPRESAFDDERRLKQT